MNLEKPSCGPGQVQRLVRRGCITLLAGPQFLWFYSVSFTLGYFDSDKLWKVRRRTVFGHMLVLVESQCFPKLDTPRSKLRLVNTNLASAEVHCPLNFGFSMRHIVFQGIKQVGTIIGRSLPDPAQASLVIPEQATQNRGRILLPRRDQGDEFLVFGELVCQQPVSQLGAFF